MAVVRRVAEVDLGVTLTQQLTELLRECFPGYPDRVYFKLPPHLRFLAFVDDTLVGQLAVELRMIRVADQVLRRSAWSTCASVLLFARRASPRPCSTRCSPWPTTATS